MLDVRPWRFLVLALVLLAAYMPRGATAAPPIQLLVNGRALQPDVPPRIVEGRVLVPIRWVAEALHADVQWDARHRQVKVTKEPESTIVDLSTSSPSSFSVDLLDYFLLANETLAHFFANLSATDGFAFTSVPEVDVDEFYRRHPGDHLNIMESTGITWMTFIRGPWLRILDWDILAMQMDFHPTHMPIIGRELRATVRTLEVQKDYIYSRDGSRREGPYETFQRKYEITLLWKAPPDGRWRSGWRVVDIRLLDQKRISAMNKVTIPFIIRDD